MSKLFELFSKNVRSVIALFITIGGFAFLFFLLFFRIPAGNETILNVAAGIVLAVLGSVASYYFGSSKDKSDVDKADSEIEKKEAGIV
jgi:drug/metabolite transporter (DMT)-like permease